MIRVANEKDIPKILDITKGAVQYMLDVDNFIQWDEHYPNESVFEDDIKQNSLYVYIDDNSLQIIGFFVLNKQIYDAYNEANFTVNIDNSYTIHRVCCDVDHRKKGIGNLLLSEAIALCRKFEAESIIIDTNSKNIAMNKIIKQVGFNFVGTMNLKPNLPHWNCYEYKL